MNLTGWLFEHSRYLAKEAIVSTCGAIHYAELFDQVNRVSYVATSQFERGARVGVLAANGWFFVAAYLGLIKAGCIAMLLDQADPPEEIRAQVERAKLKAVLAQDRPAAKLADLSLTVIAESDWNEIFAGPVPHDFSDLFLGEGNDPAVIMPTSGSTREKKLVLLSHTNIISNTSSIISYLDLNEADRICVVLPFHYCYGTSLLHTHVRVGGSLFLHESIFIGSVIKEINKFGCTGLAGVPTTFSILLGKTDFIDHEYPTLRYITQAGGKLANSLLSRLRDGLPNVDIVVMYGQTEASPRLSYLPSSLLSTKLGSIGRGIPGVELKVVDKEGLPVKPGQVGEIVAKGNNVMLGYLGDPVATGQRLRRGYLHTGDLATVDEDGFIYLQSREDDLIKVAGHRISPMEIEEVILTHPAVADCTAIGLEDDLLGKAVVAYVVARERDEDLTDQIHRLCAQKLPSYKQPKHIRIVRSFPLNSVFKVDRQALRERARREFLD